MPDASRRVVLAAGGIAAASLALADPVAAASAAKSSRDVPSRGVFSAVRGRTVTLTSGRIRVRAKVTSVEDLLGGRHGDARRYSLFLKPASRVPDGLYRVRGAGLPGSTLFFSNVDFRAAARLQAVVDAAPLRTRRRRHPVRPARP
jgi:hypothetical protein